MLRKKHVHSEPDAGCIVQLELYMSTRRRAGISYFDPMTLSLFWNTGIPSLYDLIPVRDRSFQRQLSEISMGECYSTCVRTFLGDMALITTHHLSVLDYRPCTAAIPCTSSLEGYVTELMSFAPKIQSTIRI